MRKLIFRLRSNSFLLKALKMSILCFLFLYIFSLPSFSGRVGYNYVSYVAMALLSILTFLYTMLFSSFKVNYLFLCLPIFIFWSFLGTVIYSHEFRNWFTLVLLFLSFLVIYFACRAFDDISLVLKIMVAALFAFGMYFIYVYRIEIFGYKNTTHFRLGSYFDNENAVGAYFLIGSVLSLYLTLFYKKKIDLLFIISFLLFAVLGITTGSRTFIVSIGAAIIVLLFLRLYNHKFIFLIIVACTIGLSLLLFNLPLLATIKHRFEQMFSTLLGGNSVEMSTIQRILWKKYGFYLGLKNLLIGYGANGFANFSGVGTYSHSNFSELLCNFGLIGFVSYYTNIVFPGFVACYKGFKSKGKAMPQWALCITIAFIILVRDMLSITYFSKTTYILVSLMFLSLNNFGKNVEVSFYTTIDSFSILRSGGGC